MPKYYSLLYLNCDSVDSCNVSNIVKISNSTDIYDYLTSIYLNYKKTKDSGKFDDLCDRLDLMIESINDDVDIPFEINYENVYEWIKYSCSEDSFDQIRITKHELISEY